MCIYMFVCTYVIMYNICLYYIYIQHATDEKYNYERLQRDTAIDHQMLIQ